MQKLITVLLTSVVVLLGTMAFKYISSDALPDFGTSYQSVVLTDGQVYYGKLENAGGQYLVLKDVFYITSQVNPTTKQTSKVIVRRGRELHGPKYMVLNRQSILFIEPIKEDSQVGKFIAKQSKQSN